AALAGALRFARCHLRRIPCARVARREPSSAHAQGGSMIRKLVLLGVVVSLSAGCYHATVVTGATPGSEKIEKDWAASFVAGLVAPDTVESQSQCSAGVARVETVHSFLNSLVGIVTLAIYTPMSIEVTCAAGGAAPPMPAK